jgi:hypothetical protein
MGIWYYARDDHELRLQPRMKADFQDRSNERITQ